MKANSCLRGFEAGLHVYTILDNAPLLLFVLSHSVPTIRSRYGLYTPQIFTLEKAT
jgi:hypothetical protein